MIASKIGPTFKQKDVLCALRGSINEQRGKHCTVAEFKDLSCFASTGDKLAKTCIHEIKKSISILKEKEVAGALGRQVSVVLQQQLR